MSRLPRRTLTALSLFLCATSAILWLRSGGPGVGADSLDLTRSDPLYWIISNRGRLTFCRQNGRDWESPRPAFNVLGLEFAGSRVGNSSLYNLFVPYWMLVTVTLVGPTIALARWPARRRRAHRQRNGLCPRCGYDLRATPTRCPECGTPQETA